MTPEKIRALIQQVQNDTLYEGRYTEEDRLVEAVEGLVKSATNPLHNKIIELEVQLKQAEQAKENARLEERKACLKIAKNWYEKAKTNWQLSGQGIANGFVKDITKRKEQI